MTADTFLANLSRITQQCQHQRHLRRTALRPHHITGQIRGISISDLTHDLHAIHKACSQQ